MRRKTKLCRRVSELRNKVPFLFLFCHGCAVFDTKIIFPMGHREAQMFKLRQRLLSFVDIAERGVALLKT